MRLPARTHRTAGTPALCAQDPIGARNCSGTALMSTQRAPDKTSVSETSERKVDNQGKTCVQGVDRVRRGSLLAGSASMRDTRTCKLTRKIPTMSAATSLTGVATGAEVHAYVPRAGYPDLIPAELSGRVVRRQIGAYAVPEYQPDPLDLPGAARTLDTFRNWRSRITWARSLGPGGHVHAFAEASKTLLGHDRLAQ
jgi:hypothetical protein